ncbi:hypothetical protein SynA1544_01807 [Synechococcus sp. A15-44]|nr:hypothetical protein SynA1544_01807 [Synechococcus sp. A15-44]
MLGGRQQNDRLLAKHLRQRIDPLILFKMLILKQLFNLSDDNLEILINDRRSFERQASSRSSSR